MATRISDSSITTNTNVSGVKNGHSFSSTSSITTNTRSVTSSRVNRSFGDRISSSKGSLFNGLGAALTGIMGSTFAFFIIFLFIRKGLGLPYISLSTIINLYNSRLAILNEGTLTTIIDGTSEFSLITLFSGIYKYLGSVDTFISDLVDWFNDNVNTAGQIVINLVLGPVFFIAEMTTHFIRVVLVIFSIFNLVINNITALVSTFIDVLSFDNSLMGTSSSVPTEQSIWQLLIT